MILCPFSKITIFGSPLGYTTSIAVSDWSSLQYQVSIPSFGAIFKLNQELVGYLPSIHATIATIGIRYEFLKLT